MMDPGLSLKLMPHLQRKMQTSYSYLLYSYDIVVNAVRIHGSAIFLHATLAITFITNLRPGNNQNVMNAYLNYIHAFVFFQMSTLAALSLQ